MTDTTPQPTVEPAPKRRKALVLLLLIGLMVYANAFNKGFVLDDAYWITTHPNIGNAGDYIWRSSARPLVAATILLNHRLGGLKPLGYHAFNIALHIASAFTLFAIFRRIFDLPGTPERLKNKGETLAFAITLLWLVHPLNTQAVTYVIQRAESMMGLFFLLAVYCWLRGSTGGRPWLWLPLALVNFFLSCATKEVAIVWPLLIVAFDRIFLAGSWKALLKQRWLAYVALAGLWAWLLYPVLVASQSGQDFGIGFGLATTPLQYASTETEVVLHYLRLSVWPTGQVGDYNAWPIASSPSAVWPAAAGIAVLVLAMFAALYFRPKLGFAIFWCLLILAPTSTIMPINDVAFEHRMYLPLIGVLALLVLGADWVIAKLPASRCVGIALLVVAVALLGRQAISRNEVYRGNAQFFADALAKRPHNRRAVEALAEIRTVEGKLDEAGAMLDSLKNQQYNTRAYLLNRARWYTEKGEPEKARMILAQMVNDPLPFSWRFWATPYPRLLLGLGDYDEAAKICLKLTEYSPSRAEGYALLATAELAAGRGDKPLAAWAWNKAVALDPQIGATIHAEARRTFFNANAPAPAGETEEAKEGRERLRRHRNQLAYHLANAVVTFTPNAEPQWYDTMAMIAAATNRWSEATSTALAGYEAAKRSGNTIWMNALNARMNRYLLGAIFGPPEK
jgi:tetratricopeptide (TPR) repeat protein